jgi:hypothetical protein
MMITGCGPVVWQITDDDDWLWTCRLTDYWWWWLAVDLSSDRLLMMMTGCGPVVWQITDDDDWLWTCRVTDYCWCWCVKICYNVLCFHNHGTRCKKNSKCNIYSFHGSRGFVNEHQCFVTRTLCLSFLYFLRWNRFIKREMWRLSCLVRWLSEGET